MSMVATRSGGTGQSRVDRMFTSRVQVRFGSIYYIVASQLLYDITVSVADMYSNVAVTKNGAACADHKLLSR